MKTWSEYKDYVKTVDKKTGKEIAAIEAEVRAEIASRKDKKTHKKRSRQYATVSMDLTAIKRLKKYSDKLSGNAAKAALDIASMKRPERFTVLSDNGKKICIKGKEKKGN